MEWPEQLARFGESVAGSVSGPCGDLRRLALALALTGLEAADPGTATRRCVSYNPTIDTIQVDGVDYGLATRAKVWVVGAGKASYPIAAALEEILGDRIAGGVVAVRDPAVNPLRHVTVLASDHPLPTSRSVEAAVQILGVAEQAVEGDLVIACFTGGSSALASLPPSQVSAADKRALHEVMLSSGLAITEINAVRKSVSAFKGGRVALVAAPATVVNLTVSDVTGSPLDAITDPTVQDTATAAYARSVIKAKGIWGSIPESVRLHLEQDLATPRLPREPQTVMLADGRSPVAAMAAAAGKLGSRVVTVDSDVEGEADVVGTRLACRLIDEVDQSPKSRVILLGCGGESVVTVDDPKTFSMGGPNQHAALRAAGVLRGRRAAAVFIDTDGSDGGTEFAGALVDGWTSDLAIERGVDVPSALAQRRSSGACEALDATIRTGHTGTNVNDLFVLVGEEGVLS